MRKPLVVVCAAASAMLLGGGVVATAAGASETPDEPGFGFSMPSLWGWPQFGGGSDDDTSDFSDDADDADDADFDEDPAAGHADDAGDGSLVEDPDAVRDDDSPGDDRHADAVPQKPATQPDRTDPRNHSQADAAPQRPAAQQQRQQARQKQAAPARDLGFAQRPAADSLLATARQDVTRADVSSSPYARWQQQILWLVNQNRRRGGCDNLSVDRRLIEAANEHAADMARRDYFAHQSPNGDGAGDRVSEAGYRWKRYGENIARGADSPFEVVDGWMHSPAHRENIMDCRLHQMGVGLAVTGDRTTYWVQDFATPQS
ncbi:CAP domain-containing protein [Paractinoplanes toevensis]|uniref:SCP domain-containing protein n=1 Tax=Paractinoplanes toevensis TaxID=571911 RepID=A0A919TDJ6_9ACTN|nr:CAP domain-containing protein [Actinoplanes toevensis]GIM93117.1 hypothetical protein Ato02nite_049100 [Actinoplanes toevensis]